MDCARATTLIDPFIDGELEPDKILEVEQHLSECSPCMERVRLTEAMRVSTRRAVRSAAEPSEALRRRVAEAFAAERAQVAKEGKSDRGELSWRAVVPLATAAAVALAFGGLLERPKAVSPLAADEDPPPTTSAVASMEKLLDDLVSYHAAPPIPDITDPEMVGRLGPEVGIPVRLPELSEYGARWEGGGVILMPGPQPETHKERAAVFRYQLSSRPVTVYIYNARRVPLRGVLEPRVVRNVPVHVGAHRGYSVAVREGRGVGYLVASDLDGEETAEIAAVVH